MAKFSAFSEVDIVGSMVSLPLPLSANSLTGSPNAFFVFVPPSPPPEYFIFNTDSNFLPAASITSFSQIASATPFAIGAGQVQQIWKADSGDSYPMGTAGVASDDTFFGLLFAPKAGDPTKTHGTEQQVNQFFFKFDDYIHGSNEDDMLCGWAGKDKVWGNEGDDEFYYGEGMGKDKFMDVNKKKDEVILDTDLVKNFKKLKGDVKLKNDKVVLKFDSSDKLVIYGIDTLKDLKKVVAFDDFTDFS